MSTVQFEPKVTVDFQIDWRRPSTQVPFELPMSSSIRGDPACRRACWRETLGSRISFFAQ